jgi:hypothetical protein
MHLINGISTNGTFLGIIPTQPEQTRVKYSSKDNLGYSFHSKFSAHQEDSGTQIGEYVPRDLRITYVSNIHGGLPS